MVGAIKNFMYSSCTTTMLCRVFYGAYRNVYVTNVLCKAK